MLNHLILQCMVAKSCTTKGWLKPQQNNGINHLSTGAGFPWPIRSSIWGEGITSQRLDRPWLRRSERSQDILVHHCNDVQRPGETGDSWTPSERKWWFWGWFTIALPTWEICLIMFKDLGLNLRLESAMLICWVWKILGKFFRDFTDKNWVVVAISCGVRTSSGNLISPSGSILGQSYMATLILTSLLVSMGISTFTSKEFVIFCRASAWLAMNRGMSSWSWDLWMVDELGNLFTVLAFQQLDLCRCFWTTKNSQKHCFPDHFFSGVEWFFSITSILRNLRQ